MTTEPTESQALVLAEDNGINLVSAALVLCQGSIKAAEFDATNPFFKSKYATLGSVIAASREALFNAGLAVLQVPSIQGDIVSVHTRIVHKSGQSLDCGVMALPLEGNDRNSDAQVAGSILTYLKRYAWASVLGIYADLDDDGNSGPKGAIPRSKPLSASGSLSEPTRPNKTPPEPSSAPPEPLPEAPAKKFDVEKTRIRTLNLLKAAPGQPNRVLVTDYLDSRGWISGAQIAEDWPAEHLPQSKEALDALSEDIQRFETLAREQNDEVTP